MNILHEYDPHIIRVLNMREDRLPDPPVYTCTVCRGARRVSGKRCYCCKGTGTIERRPRPIRKCR